MLMGQFNIAGDLLLNAPFYVWKRQPFFLGMRRVEIRHLKWSDIDFAANVLEIRRSKTKAGWRMPPLNDICRQALLDLYVVAKETTGAESDHYLFLARGKDVTQPMKDWRSAWRSLRKAAGLDGLRFHDGRHSAITAAGEKGRPEQTMQALFGHIDPAMLKHYAHTRRRALEEAANALQPTFIRQQPITVEMIN
jgi:integrase